ncbi:MAG TPA: sigma-70 family RNA polymerase sigma factor [Draconibacterium sp.]|nr:sigma-70 family RNA polymerase sigma factor [Draconibacterium sp.]
MALTDKELIGRIKTGNQDAFKELYHRYSDLLFAFIMIRLDNNNEASSDIWQETWIIAVEKISDFSFKSTVFTWLCAIAKNKISDYYRLNEKHRKISNEVRNHIDIDNEEIDMVDDVVQEDVLTVLANLNEEYRYLLLSRYFENKSVEEISQAIGKSYKATESLLTRSREAFRKKFRQINKP